MVMVEEYKVEPKPITGSLVAITLIKKGEREVEEVAEQLQDNEVILVKDEGEISVHAGKIDADYVLPKPVLVNKIGVPSSVSDSVASMLFFNLEGTLVYGIKVGAEFPFIYLETTEGTKIITMSEIREPKSTRLEQPSKTEVKRVKRVKKSASKRKSKSKSTRKSRRV
ncbi:hypothetical protein [Sulfuracidifex tepidarius]|uniref:Uncharacterized protein n=1 Tax=Sulfuracidifex tepidarius TaxID=1294262 RepID=A0A510E3A3_9CREN|nr:hypothetical protein [Sulfuracidifex tepidarius]BBG26560.1 hypothetical protein IC007_1075 [Sulfuracidifex tepidarius]